VYNWGRRDLGTRGRKGQLRVGYVLLTMRPAIPGIKCQVG